MKIQTSQIKKQEELQQLLKKFQNQHPTKQSFNRNFGMQSRIHAVQNMQRASGKRGK